MSSDAPMAFELKYPGLDFRRATAMEALLCGLEEGDYMDADVREAFHCHIHITKGKMIHYWFSEDNYIHRIKVVEMSTLRGF